MFHVFNCKFPTITWNHFCSSIIKKSILNFPLQENSISIFLNWQEIWSFSFRSIIPKRRKTYELKSVIVNWTSNASRYMLREILTIILKYWLLISVHFNVSAAASPSRNLFAEAVEVIVENRCFNKSHYVEQSQYCRIFTCFTTTKRSNYYGPLCKLNASSWNISALDIIKNAWNI